MMNSFKTLQIFQTLVQSRLLRKAQKQTLPVSWLTLTCISCQILRRLLMSSPTYSCTWLLLTSLHLSQLFSSAYFQSKFLTRECVQKCFHYTRTKVLKVTSIHIGLLVLHHRYVSYYNQSSKTLHLPILLQVLPFPHLCIVLSLKNLLLQT